MRLLDRPSRLIVFLAIFAAISIVSFWRKWSFQIQPSRDSSKPAPCENLPDHSCHRRGSWSNFEIQRRDGFWPWIVYKTSDLKPPKFEMTRTGGTLAPGYIFFGQYGPSVLGDALLVMTSTGDLVYGLAIEGAKDVRVQLFRNESFLTFFSEYETNSPGIGHTYGQVNFLDHQYEPAFVVCSKLNLFTGLVPPPPCRIDSHEHQMTSRNTMLVTAYNLTSADLTAINGSSDAWIYDSLFFELDVETSEVLFSWDARDHVSFTASYQPLHDRGSYAKPWDFFHINSVEAVGTDYLVSSRHTWSTYLVSGDDGHIIWYIDGENGGDFGPLSANSRFRWQHTARAHNVTDNDMVLSLFNNQNAMIDNGTAPSNGLVLQVGFGRGARKPLRVVQRLETPGDKLFAVGQGSYTLGIAGTRNQLFDYGQEPVLQEYGPISEGSDLRWEAKFALHDPPGQTYRVFKGDWRGTPAKWDPKFLVERRDSSSAEPLCLTGYVSWNGATDITDWNLFKKNHRENEMSLVGVFEKKGFETAFCVPSDGCLQVAAARNGHEIRRSNVVCF